VFDGHNGVEAASYCASQLHQNLIRNLSMEFSMEDALINAFSNTDIAFLKKCREERLKSGATAVVTVLTPEKLFVAWAGDSQAVLAKKTEIIDLVVPHKPEREVRI